ncbi:MAG: MarC family protein [Parcubacteria group bacterium]|nr:MarC family protein [Parcubacteria group bacterium]
MNIMLSFIQVFFAIFGVMDPVGNVPFFIALTNSMDQAAKTKLALRAVLYAGVILIVFMFLGNSILDVFHVSMESFRMAGGLVLLILGFQILFGIEFSNQKNELLEEKDVSIVPLATPLIAGPGMITSVVILSKEYGYVFTLAGIIANLALSFVLFRFAHIVLRILGKRSAMVFAKIMGLILMAIGVEFIRSAL